MHRPCVPCCVKCDDIPPGSFAALPLRSAKGGTASGLAEPVPRRPRARSAPRPSAPWFARLGRVASTHALRHDAPGDTMTTLHDCRARDAADPLRALRALFTIPEGVVYLDGNSLGVMPAAPPARIAAAVTEEWGQQLIRAWNSAGWFELPQRLGDKLARLVGAQPGELVCTDSTSVNLFKVLSAALK